MGMRFGGLPKKLASSSDITIVSNSYMIPECLDAAKELNDRHAITCDIFI